MPVQTHRGYFGKTAARLCALVAVLLLALSAGCSPASTPDGSETPLTPSDAGYPAPTAYDPGYPAPDAEPESGELGGEPGGPGLMGAPAIENRSRITARLIESGPYVEQPDYTRLRVELLSSEPVDGMQDFTAGRIGQQIDLLVSPQDLPTLAAGDTLQALVSYEGDERGGVFFASQVQAAAP
jgi:hypothetical protein